VVDTAPEVSKAEDSYDSVSMMLTAAQQDDREGNNQRRDDMKCATKRKGEMDGKSYRLYRQSISRWGVALHDAVQGEIAAPERYR
jgi:hypothetical protein